MSPSEIAVRAAIAGEAAYRTKINAGRTEAAAIKAYRRAYYHEIPPCQVNYIDPPRVKPIRAP